MNFWKMHGLGNDFILIDNRDAKIGNKDAPALAVTMCERRFGVGADGILLGVQFQDCRHRHANLQR